MCRCADIERLPVGDTVKSDPLWSKRLSAGDEEAAPVLYCSKFRAQLLILFSINFSNFTACEFDDSYAQLLLCLFEVGLIGNL